ncbi:DMT family transporter [Flavobacterium cerinum]|uniref:DMT family transporter n=1 Tax=Flavobacterium cerinum TaxID=2502784 RepID=A0ABY5IWG7_9FLAO|nr:DMT family transporter [Flavobacterium cerinum]UUC45801.1 DMT family transporter [Flavobacterium cerinum]
MNTKKLNGLLYVLAGGISYGILASIVKYANLQGIHTSVLTFLQFFIGFLFLGIVNSILKKKHPVTTTTTSKVRLIIWGSSLGLTTTLYYLSIQFIPVSVGIILLMQSIWISIVVESFLQKKRPTLVKIVGALVCIIGTLLVTEVFNQHIALDWKGLLLGFGAGISYTISIYSSSTIEKQLPNYTRSLYLVMGGLILISVFWNYTIPGNISVNAIYWGALLAIFGTILPPLFFTAGIPKTGIGIGSIISSIEIPVSVFAAHLVLQENISGIQWIGILIILISVILVNINFKKSI